MRVPVTDPQLLLKASNRLHDALGETYVVFLGNPNYSPETKIGLVGELAQHLDKPAIHPDDIAAASRPIQPFLSQLRTQLTAAMALSVIEQAPQNPFCTAAMPRLNLAMHDMGDTGKALANQQGGFTALMHQNKAPDRGPGTGIG